jgi:hypothetical protein
MPLKQTRPNCRLWGHHGCARARRRSSGSATEIAISLKFDGIALSHCLSTKTRSCRPNSPTETVLLGGNDAAVQHFCSELSDDQRNVRTPGCCGKAQNKEEAPATAGGFLSSSASISQS